METYDRTLLPRFSQMLVQREAELRALLRATVELPSDADGSSPCGAMDFKDVAMEQALATVDDAKAAHAVLELGEVLAARRRLSDASFGHCLDCGEAIDLRRLAARPAAALCTMCQAIHEHERPLAMRR